MCPAADTIAMLAARTTTRTIPAEMRLSPFNMRRSEWLERWVHPYSIDGTAQHAPRERHKLVRAG
jgi:hypothetical protein